MTWPKHQSTQNINHKTVNRYRFPKLQQSRYQIKSGNNHVVFGIELAPPSIKEERNAILQKLIPGGGDASNIGLTQDLLENRFQAKYLQDVVAMPDQPGPFNFKQKYFSRSYKLQRTCENALLDVLGWLWGKHGCISGEQCDVAVMLADKPEHDRQLLLNPPLGQIKRARLV
jgi:hypothetical protein